MKVTQSMEIDKDHTKYGNISRSHKAWTKIKVTQSMEIDGYTKYGNILRRKSLVSTDTVCNNFVRQS